MDEMKVETIDNGRLLFEAMSEARRIMIQHRDEQQARKLQQVIEKLHSDALHIAFCGHFSAGKSSLINRLCGHQLLPSSPIPTSANVVSIYHGQPLAKVTYRDVHEHPESTQMMGLHRPSLSSLKTQRVELNELNEFCKNGEQIERIEVNYPIPWLGDHGVLIDTPGIDSTDDNHLQATQSALHVADVVCYVMDYNYVQSDLNFAFIKKISDWGKPVYLIINMIDKHKPQELSFAQFREMTEQAFVQYGIQSAGFLYVSTKDMDHPHNEWEALVPLLQQLIEQRTSLLIRSADASFRFLSEEHVSWFKQFQMAARERSLERLGDPDERGWNDEVKAMQQHIADWQQQPEKLELTLRNELTRTIENANITPALTRDRAHAFLEATRPNFRLGLFARASQTEAEVMKRTQLFRDDFAEQVRSQLDWHVQAIIKKEAQKQELYREELIHLIDELHYEITAQWLTNHIHPGALASGEYTLNFMKQLAMEYKQIIRRQAFAVLDELLRLVRQRNESAIEQAKEQVTEYAKKLEGWNELQALDQQETELESQFARLENGPWKISISTMRLPVIPKNEDSTSMHPSTQHTHAAEPSVVSAHNSNLAKSSDLTSLQSVQAQSMQMSRKATQLREAAHHLQAIPRLSSYGHALRAKAERLSNRTFTIALFGAFSAGKSSFANALLGKRVLPVSPNPTTAAINRIRYPEADWPHGTAKVQMKSAEGIFLDVQYSLQLLGYSVSQMAEAINQIRKLQIERIPSKGKVHFTFLKAVEQGWSLVESTLGQQVRITEDQFASYIAKETMSCFIEVIDVYDANPWTEQGIVLVDTPGADSINARHTEVAFTYIKNADAILFVTYYNHAFSQADREFLLQLGRVKDSFELDKMFFIVNAADLASTAEECEEVVRHVERNIVQQGIRQPRIYPLSSYEAIESKLTQDRTLFVKSGMDKFESDFFAFSLHELQDIALHAADQELRRTIHTIEQWMEAANQSEHQRQSHIAQSQNAYADAVALLAQLDNTPAQRELRKEMEEYMYYVKQRSMFRFGEWYNMAFHPSTFRELVHDPKQALRIGWEEFVQRLVYNLKQEVLATTLRIENQINRFAFEFLDDAHRRIASVVKHIEWNTFEPQRFDIPQLATQLEIPEISDKMLLSTFKSSKYFFENEGKAQLRTKLEQLLTPHIETWTSAQIQEFVQIYEPLFHQVILEHRSQLAMQLEEHQAGLLAALTMDFEIEQLHTLRMKLTELLDDSK